LPAAARRRPGHRSGRGRDQSLSGQRRARARRGPRRPVRRRPGAGRPRLRRAELERFLDAVPEGTLVVLDEAYREFVTDPDVPDGLELMRGRPNVAVLRTFSKAWGLAGLRVGYLIAEDPAVADAVRKTSVPFSVSTLAQAAAVAALAS